MLRVESCPGVTIAKLTGPVHSLLVISFLPCSIAFPQIIVKGELIGGLDILKELIASGEFAELIEGI
jgi:hypothetical protein